MKKQAMEKPKKLTKRLIYAKEPTYEECEIIYVDGRRYRDITELLFCDSFYVRST